MLRVFKQFIIAIFTLLLFGGLIFLLIFLFRPQPTCFDNIQNQEEEGIDCGGPCEEKCPILPQEDLKVLSTHFFRISGNLYNLAGEVKNPNGDVGIKSFSYEFNIYGPEEKLLISRTGTSFILPQEEKYVVETGVYIDGFPQEIEFKIYDEVWALPLFAAPHFEFSSSRFEAGKASGILKNKSNFGYEVVEVVALLLDKNQKPLSISKTELKTLKGLTERYFEINWPTVPGEVRDLRFFAYTNTLLRSNIILPPKEERSLE